MQAMLELVPHLLAMGATDREVAYVQLVAAEIDAFVTRIRQGAVDVSIPAKVRRAFRWTESPSNTAAIVYEFKLFGATGLGRKEREQVSEIYRAAMLHRFKGLARAFRAWAEWKLAPGSVDAKQWPLHHDRANAWAFAGLEVGPKARVAVSFDLRM